jgi:hypothetical protein
MTSTQSFTRICTNQTKSWLLDSLSTFGARTNHGQLRTHKTHHNPNLGASHHLPPYSILCASSWCPHPNGILSWDSQVGVSEFPQLELPQLWGPITLRADLWLQWGLKQSYSPCWELCNGMFHVIFTWRKRGDFWRLVVKLPIWPLTFLLTITCVLDVQMGHASPFQTSTFQDFSNNIRKASIHWILTPVIALWKFRSPFETPTPDMRVHLGVLGFICTPGNMECDCQASLLACTLASLCFGCEPKARVATTNSLFFCYFH